MPTWGAWPDDITTDQTVTAAWLTKVSQSLAFMEEIAYAEFTSPVSITATTEGTANVIVSAGSIAYEAGVPHLIRAWFPRFDAGTGTSRVYLFGDSTALGVGISIGSGVQASPALLERRVTPTGTHTYSVRAMVGSGTGTAQAGAGGTGNVFLPGWIRVYRIAT